MTGQMENVVGDACLAIRPAEQAGRAPLFPGAGHRTHGSLAAPLERGEVHIFPGDDLPACLTCHRVLQDLTKD